MKIELSYNEEPNLLDNVQYYKIDSVQKHVVNIIQTSSLTQYTVRHMVKNDV